jgi:hypothetical protein
MAQLGSGIFITSGDYSQMPTELQKAIGEWLASQHTARGAASSDIKAAAKDADRGPTPVDEDDEVWEPSDLSPAQAKTFLVNCNEKTKTVLRHVFSQGERTFSHKGIGQLMGLPSGGSLSGAWGGITKRTRTILGDKHANLFSWEWSDETEDWIGTSSEMTYTSMRKALSL